MLQGGWISRQASWAKEINRIKPALQEIKNDDSQRLLESMNQIMSFFFGTPDSNGMLYRFGTEFANYDALEWVSQLQKLFQHIGPESPVFAQILKRNRDPNSSILIHPSYMPHYLDASSFDKGRLLSARVLHSGISLQPLDAYLMMLAYAVFNSDQIAHPVTQIQNLFIDQFFTSLSRNPLLVLLRKVLQFFNGRDKDAMQKIVYLIRIYLMDEVVIKYEQDKSKNGYTQQDNSKLLNISQESILSVSSNRKSSIQLKYRVKNHHIHTLYLLLKYCPEYLSNDLLKYCQAMTEYLPVLRPDQFSLQSLIRLFIYLVGIKNQLNIENEVIRALDKSNSKDGWFVLKRYSPTSIIMPSNPSLYNLQTIMNIIKLLQKQSQWIANPSYLFTFACLFRFLSTGKIYYNEFANTRRNLGMSDSKDNSLVQKVMRLIIVRFNQSMVDVLSKIKHKNTIGQFKQSLGLIQEYEHLIQQYYGQYFKSKSLSYSSSTSPQISQFYTSPRSPSPSPLSSMLSQHGSISPIQQLSPEFKFKQVNEKQLQSAADNSNIATNDAIQRMNSESKRGLVSYYRREPRNCWQVPIQYNQSVILYWVLFTIAKIVDFVIPGRAKRQYPCLNIRFLANPLTFLGVVIVIILGFLLFR